MDAAHWGRGSMWVEKGMKASDHDRPDRRTEPLCDNEIVITKHEAREIFC